MSTPSQVVLVENNPRFGVASAEEFGEIRVLRNPNSPSPFQTKWCIEEFRTRLLEISFDPSRDFVLLTGGANVVPLMIAVIIAEYGTAKVLLFDSARKRYFERELHTDELHADAKKEPNTR